MWNKHGRNQMSYTYDDLLRRIKKNPFMGTNITQVKR